MCGREDSNLPGPPGPPDPKSGASACSATPACSSSHTSIRCRRGGGSGSAGPVDAPAGDGGRADARRAAGSSSRRPAGRRVRVVRLELTRAARPPGFKAGASADSATPARTPAGEAGSVLRGTGGGRRTLTGLSAHRLLRPARLPIPPHPLAPPRARPAGRVVWPGFEPGASWASRRRSSRLSYQTMDDASRYDVMSCSVCGW